MRQNKIMKVNQNISKNTINISTIRYPLLIRGKI